MLITAAGAAVVGTFVLRFLTVDFPNDHFVHLTRAWQILQGDVPNRDFFDPGLFLTYYVSAAALWLGGHNLFGEAILTAGFIAAGAGLTLVVSAHLSRSIWIASVATILAVLAMPRLYNYPKAFLYVLAIALGCRYAARPDRGAPIALALVTAVAFLFRHDHGVYIALALLVLIALAHWNRPGRAAMALAGYAILTLAALAPFLVFVQLSSGLLGYARDIVPQAETATNVRASWQPLPIDVALFAATAADRRVNVRWDAGVGDDQRETLERRHGLLAAAHVEDTTWSYRLASDDLLAITALVTDPAVEDTHGIDRIGQATMTGLFSRRNALAFVFDAVLLLPFISVILAGWLLARGEVGRAEAAVVGMVTVLCVVLIQTLVRGEPDTRLSDAMGPLCVLGSWVCARALELRAGWRPWPSRVWVGGAAVVGMMVVWSVAAGLSLPALTGLFGRPDRLWRGIDEFRVRPIDRLVHLEHGTARLTRYVFACTPPTDRILVTWFAPEVYFLAERAFAGGQAYLYPGWHASPADQARTVDQIQRERVPIVLENEDFDYERYFPAVADYVHTHYGVAPMQDESMQGYRVRVKNGLTPTGTYAPLGLPCYQ